MERSNEILLTKTATGLSLALGPLLANPWFLGYSVLRLWGQSDLDFVFFPLTFIYCMCMLINFLVFIE